MSRTASRSTISIHVLRGVFAEAIARGQEPAALCARFGVTPAQLADADGRVPGPLMLRVWDELPGLLGDDNFGLSVARRAHEAGALSIFGYVVQSAATLGEGLRRALRYEALMQDASTSVMTSRESQVRVVIVDKDPALSTPRHAIEFAFASMLLLARRTTGQALSPMRVEMTHKKPRDTTEHARLFGCDIAFSARENAVVIAPAMLEIAQLTADPHLAEMLERHARELDARLPKGDAFSVRVRRALVESLPSGLTELEHVAAKLHVSPRTAQRRLRDEGFTHHRVLDELRRDLALRYMQDDAFGLQEIAFLVGFSDQSAFHRAFVRWTGERPSAYRKTGRAQGSA